MATARIELPPKLVPVFTGESRYRGAHGGRGSGKSFSFAKMLAVRGYAQKIKILCCRELQNSIKDSVHSEIVGAIESEPWLADFYDWGESYIRGRNGTDFIFKGLRHNYREIKSTAGIMIAWVEEAEAVSELSWRTLIPTIRESGSEIWLTWNPESEDSPTNTRFVKNPPKSSKIIRLNYQDNPWFPEELEQERLHDLKIDPVIYAHVWDGECITRTDAQILKDKWEISEFTPKSYFDGPYCGLDFGFANDPTAAIKTWIGDDNLYIEYEAGAVNLELDDTVRYVTERIPEFSLHTIRADNARPESISYLKRNGLPKIIPVKKGPGSIADGIAHLRSFNKIIIHPRCEQTAKEARLYSYKVDRRSDDVLPVIIDANNHYIDAIRYAQENVMMHKNNSLLAAMEAA